MKRFASATILTLMLFGLVACGDSADKKTEATTETTTVAASTEEKTTEKKTLKKVNSED